MSAFALIDFETTGLSPNLGDRPTEIAVIVVRDGQIVGEMASLMNPLRPIPREVEQLTGITSAMVAAAPAVHTVMRAACKLIGGLPIVAHNAAFDRRFWQAETVAMSGPAPARFACTMLLARRLYPHAANHRLGELVKLHRLPATRAHRARADVQMTYHLWRKMDADVRRQFGGVPLTFALMAKLQRARRDQLQLAVDRYLSTGARGAIGT